jgi:opacity protein-like surface antigen
MVPFTTEAEMKKHHYYVAVLAVAAIAAAPLTAQAQGGLGVKAGFSWGNAPNNGGVLPGNLSAHNGAALGIGMNSGGVVGFGVEGLYAERGFSSTAAGSSQRLSVLDVPVYLRFAAENPGITPFAYVGPQGSFEIRCDGGGATCPSGREKTTYAGIIGGGLKFGPNAGFSVEGRYVYGLTDLHLSTVTTNENYRTRSFMLLAGFGF